MATVAAGASFNSRHNLQTCSFCAGLGGSGCVFFCDEMKTKNMYIRSFVHVPLGIAATSLTLSSVASANSSRVVSLAIVLAVHLLFPECVGFCNRKSVGGGWRYNMPTEKLPLICPTTAQNSTAQHSTTLIPPRPQLAITRPSGQLPSMHHFLASSHRAPSTCLCCSVAR